MDQDSPPRAAREQEAEPPVSRLQSYVQGKLGLAVERGGLARALQGFASKKTRVLGLPNEDALAAALAADDSTYAELVEAVTVPHSWFFRDLEQLEGAASVIAERAAGGRVARVWIPACASGEDPYSIAALAADRKAAIELLGTDVNSAALRRARQGVYGGWSVRWVPAHLHRHLCPRQSKSYAVAPALKRCVSFAEHNLLHAPPASSSSDGLWDLVMCRNVLIYFTREHARRVIENLRESLAPGGALILGASDIVFELPSGLTPVQVGNRLVFLRGEPEHAFVPRELPSLTPPPSAEALPSPAALPCKPALPEALPTVVAPPCEPEPCAGSPEDDDLPAALHHMRDGIRKYLGGEVQEAAKDLRAALVLQARLWPAAYYLALCHDAAGQVRDARRLYVRVAELIASGVELPGESEEDFRFLERDVLKIAKARGAATR